MILSLQLIGLRYAPREPAVGRAFAKLPSSAHQEREDIDKDETNNKALTNRNKAQLCHFIVEPKNEQAMAQIYMIGRAVDRSKNRHAPLSYMLCQLVCYKKNEENSRYAIKDMKLV